MGRETSESKGRLTLQQRMLLARLECAADRLMLACRVEQRMSGGPAEVLLKNVRLIRTGLNMAHPFLPAPLRILSWLVRSLP